MEQTKPMNIVQFIFKNKEINTQISKAFYNSSVIASGGITSNALETKVAPSTVDAK